MNAAPKNVWRAVLVDDERLARQRLKHLLASHPNVSVVGEAADLAAARLVTQEQQPDVVFLDINLSPGDGFDLLPTLPAETAVVFVTAHATYGVRAFETNALDYLLKPVHPDRLATTLQRLGSKLRTPAAGNHRLAPDETIILKSGLGWRRFLPQEITTIIAAGSYSRTGLRNGEPVLLLRSLDEWDRLLPTTGFLRVGRSLIVNLGAVQHFDIKNRDEALLHLQGTKTPVPLGRVAIRELRRALEAPQKED
jgi:two-component system LytT family response regulator